MADKIKIRRGLFTDLPILDEGEFGLVTDRGTVYIGTESDGNLLVNPILLSPDGYTIDGYLYPAVDNVHGLGTPDKRWQSISVGPGSLHVIAKNTDPGYTESNEFTIGIDPVSNKFQVASGDSILIELDPVSGAVFPSGGSAPGGVSAITEQEHYNQLSEAIDHLRVAADAYGTGGTEQEHYIQLSEAIDHLRVASDAYGINIDEHYIQLSEAIDHLRTAADAYGTGGTEQEHYIQLSEAIDHLRTAADAYGINIDEHYVQQAQINQSILQALDGYTVVPDVTAIGDGYVAFFIDGGRQIAGDNDLFWDRNSNSLNVGSINSTRAISVGFTGLASNIDPDVQVGDTNFKLDFDAGGTGIPGLVVDTGSDRLDFIRSTNQYRFIIGGTNYFTLTSTTAAFSTTTHTFAGVVRPSSDNTIDSGANTIRWQTLFMGTRVNIGLTTSSTPLGKLHIVDENATDVFTIDRYTATATPTSTIDLRRGRGTQVSKTTIADGDAIGTIRGLGYDGTSGIFRTAAEIRFEVDGTVTAGTPDMPGRIVLYTSPDGSATPLERMRIDKDGRVGIGTTLPDQTLHVHKASAGTVAANSGATIVMESNGNNWLHMLSPNTVHSGLLFGTPEDPLSGAVQFNTTNIRGGIALVTGPNLAFQTLVASVDGLVGIRTATPIEALTVSGTLALRELVAGEFPVAQDGYGKVYVKDDNILYYKDGLGVEFDLLSSVGGGVSETTFQENKTAQNQINQSVLQSLDGYVTETTFQENKTAQNQINQSVLQALDGYAVAPDTSALGDGYVAFFIDGGRQIAGDNDLYWNRETNRLGIGTQNPQAILHVAGDGYFDGNIYPITDDTGDLGSQNNRWQSLWLGPNSLHIRSNASETGGVERTWDVGNDTSGNFTIQQDTTTHIQIRHIDGAPPDAYCGIGVFPTSKLHVGGDICLGDSPSYGYPVSVILWNKTGTTIPIGSIVVADTPFIAGPTTFLACKTTTSGSDRTAIGVAYEDIFPTSSGKVAITGAVRVLTTGGVTAGDGVETSTTAGRAQATATSNSSRIGVFMETVAGTGMAWIILR